MLLNFIKMQGTGNDFILVSGNKYDFSEMKDSIKKISRRLCDRHFGIGGDGLILVLPAENEDNDYRMRIFNSDGSEAEMCGNGIRCFAHYVYSQGLTDKNLLKIETRAGIIKPEIISYKSGKSKVRVDMGKPAFHPDKIPVNVRGQRNIFDYKLAVKDHNFKINCVSMGNPHTIIFTENIEDIDLAYWGNIIENHQLFPQKTNVEFVEVMKPNEINIRVWERGSGITLACGTGACASVAAGIKKGLLSSKVSTHLPGGVLEIEWSRDNIMMTGPAETVFSGKIMIQE